MERFIRIIRDAVLAVQILIVFVLVFEESLVLPAAIQSFGRLHPALLHLPIGLLLVSAILLFARRRFGSEAIDELTDILFHVTALTASITTLMGLFLSLEGTFGPDEIRLHKWFGVALSFFCWGLLLFNYNEKAKKTLAGVGIVLLILTGHFGASLTHGEDFVLGPFLTEGPREARILTDSSTIFEAAIEPVLESKCFGCHNRGKAKGGLVMTSVDQMLEGGKNGSLWKPGDAAHSLIVERLTLPIDEKEHMPPRDKAQLTAQEISLISIWIDAGADLNIRLDDVNAPDTLKDLAMSIAPVYHQQNNGPLYTFPFVSPEKVKQLSKPNRSVFQIARNEPALQADFFLRDSYKPENLEELTSVSEQLVSLNLSKMPVTERDLETISKFRNLETLNLNNTGLSDQRLVHLAGLPRLTSLSLAGTNVTASSLNDLGSSRSLRQVYLWNTNVTREEIAALEENYPAINWELGYIPDPDEVLKLNVASLRNKGNIIGASDKVELRHNLPGVVLRYTTDGSEPDSIKSPAYNGPIDFKSLMTLKVKAFKEGWLSSDIQQFVLFREGIKPDTAILHSTPDPRYPGEGAMTLVDQNKGLVNYYKHPAWIAFRENELDATFEFQKERRTISTVTLSYVRNRGAITMSPQEVQVWGSVNDEKLKLLGTVKPKQTPQPGSATFEGLTINIEPGKYKFLRVVAKPTKRLIEDPKKKEVWLMMDEIFFN